MSLYILNVLTHLLIMPKNVKKDFSEITDDLHLGSAIEVRFRTGNIYEPKVIEVQFSCYVNPTSNRTVSEFEKNISHIRRKFNLLANDYVTKNQEYVLEKKICDVVFSVGNLKKGYNKSVTFTLFVRQRGDETWVQMKRLLRNGIGEMIDELTEYIRNEGFSCKKNKK